LEVLNLIICFNYD